MDKKGLIEKICLQLEKDLSALKAAALETHAAATSEQSKPENQYDTRAIEASYLAGAQAKRVLEIESSLSIYKYLDIRNYNEQSLIGVTALIELDLAGKKTCIFLVPKGVAMTVEFASKVVQVITLASPLGQALIGLQVGDTAFVEKGNETLEYVVTSVS